MKSKIKGKLHPSRLQALLAGAVLVAGMGLMATTASAATVHLSGSVGGVPTSADQYESFDSLGLGSAGGTTSTGVAVSFTADGEAVQRAVDGKYAAPFVSGGNGTNFGGQADGADATTYLTSGLGSAILTFTEQQKYLGLLWGSVDNFNTLTFFNGATQVAMFTGTDVGNSTGTGNCIGGGQGMLGTCYVNINFLAGSFDKVVATSSSYAFEFDNVAFSKTPIGVPEPGIWSMFGLGLLLVGSAYRLKGRRLG